MSVTTEVGNDTSTKYKNDHYLYALLTSILHTTRYNSIKTAFFCIFSPSHYIIQWLFNNIVYRVSHLPNYHYILPKTVS